MQDTEALTPSVRRRRRAGAAALLIWPAAVSFCLADATVHLNVMGATPAFISLRMSSIHQRRGRARSPSVKKLSSLSSTPFPNAAGTARNRHNRPRTQQNATSSWSAGLMGGDEYEEEAAMPRGRQSPLPAMPSPLFATLAQSQFELLSNSLVHIPNASENGKGEPSGPKISSMVLYLPKENQNTGQLEFVPAVTYPNPSSERVFIASDASKEGIHQPPTVPSMGVLGLPGFFPAKQLIPSYPFVSSSTDNGAEENGGMFTTASQDSPVSVSVVEEMANSPGPSSLSVTLFSGLDTLGVFWLWPYKSSDDRQNDWKWTSNDKLQVTRAAKSLALALSMDNERASTQMANEQFRVAMADSLHQFRVAMADSLHQVKSPLQALRTFGKLLQRQLAEENADGRVGTVMERVPMSTRRQQQALRLAEDMMSQGERVVDLIEPMDSLVHNGGRYLLRGDIKESPAGQLIPLPTETANQYQLPPSMPVLGDFQMETAFPQDVLGSVVYASQAISREKGTNFDAVGFEPDNLDLPKVTICQKHLKEAVSNLLDNAIKYAPCRRPGKKGRPRIPQIKVTLVSNEPPLTAGAMLYIEDNGPGIPESERDKVFERGYRGEAVEDSVEGSGLGLSIAREIVSRMGGVLDLVEGPNKLDGTAVRIILFRDPELE
ncbi:hypothetical protein ACHAXT_003864 [Thalassiosira profunda]